MKICNCGIFLHLVNSGYTPEGRSWEKAVRGVQLIIGMSSFVSGALLVITEHRNIGIQQG